jgi:hypothetical protein
VRAKKIKNLLVGTNLRLVVNVLTSSFKLN